MNFNYRDFFIHNDDLHIIKEQLSIIDEKKVFKKDALVPNAKAVWDMYAKEPNEQKIADELKINLTTVQKIIWICSKKFLENKTIKQISDETNPKIATALIYDILNNAIPDWERKYDTFSDAETEKIYNLHKEGKSPEEIVKLINQNRKSYLQIKLDKVNLVLNIADIATKQMEDPSNHGTLNMGCLNRLFPPEFHLNPSI